MGFSDLFRRQHLHPDAHVRLQAVSRLRNQRILARLAKTDPDAQVRIEASRRLVDPSILEDIVLVEPDLQVRLAAARCLKDVTVITRLLGSERLSDEVIGALVGQVRDQKTLVWLATSSARVHVRVEACRRVSDGRVLEGILLQDTDREVRLGAAQCLRDVSAVSRLLQEADLDVAAVEALDAETFRAALKQLSATKSLGELAKISPHPRVQIEAIHICDDLSRELREFLSKDKRRDDYAWSERIDKWLDQGADPNVVDARGRPALCVVAEHGYPRTVSHLLALGADVNARGPDGTPLRVATFHGHVAIVDELLAQPRLRQEGVFEAAQVALQRGETYVATRLLKFLDVLKSERYKHISALQVGAALAVIIERGSYCESIFRVVKSFIIETLKWGLTGETELRHRWDHHVQDRTYMYTIEPKGQDGAVGHLMWRKYSSDYGMGSERSGSEGGLLYVYLQNEAAQEAAVRLVSLVRAIDKKTK